MAETKPSLSPKALEKMQRHRQAVMMLARLAAKRAVQDELRARGVRVTLVLPAEIMRQAREYLASHPELYQQALERAKRMGYADPHCSNLSTDAMLTVLGGLAEFERHLIIARTTEGRQRAQQRGGHPDHPDSERRYIPSPRGSCRRAMASPGRRANPRYFLFKARVGGTRTLPLTFDGVSLIDLSA